jgi:hypothetical protein
MKRVLIWLFFIAFPVFLVPLAIIWFINRHNTPLISAVESKERGFRLKP